MSDAATVDDGMPLVGEDRGNRGLWIGLGAIGLGGIVLFSTLEASRQSSLQPQISSPRDFATASSPRPELMIPEYFRDNWRRAPNVAPLANAPLPTASPLPPARLTRLRPSAEPTPASYQPVAPANLAMQTVQPAVTDLGRTAPVIVYDAVQGAPVGDGSSVVTTKQATKAIAIGGGDRTYLVSQGTLIFAVLETAIDSTQSGQVRAMISKDVYNPMGTQMLIPKGSRIYGEYKGELGSGQNRAQVIWTRLIRPDGATISLDSPASDQLGRAGVKGRVNTHFGERLLGALLQSTIDFGVLAASRAVSNDNGVIVAIPSVAQNSTSQIIQPPPKPTLKVRHGTRIAVFVARDLDFTSVK